MLRAAAAFCVWGLVTAAGGADGWIRHVDAEDGYAIAFPAGRLVPARAAFFGVTMDALVDPGDETGTQQIFILWEPSGAMTLEQLRAALLRRIGSTDVVANASAGGVVDLVSEAGGGMLVGYHIRRIGEGFGGVMALFPAEEMPERQDLLRRIGASMRAVEGR